ncbi:hypothetical protein EWM64_g8067 [Hericium alpestre]|uniref:PX domain-containing protein n=1 Tax=Hericium alpestre TaxID=135208 RepID=A0A4Y9ZPG6_9AGAM|nr:hypothetical protein EWM64_g8067 [Hericium alpestre]
MDGFDDLLRQSTRALEENPFDNPFATHRPSSPDPWSSYAHQSTLPSHDYGVSGFQDDEIATPTTPSQPNDFEEIPTEMETLTTIESDPLDSANVNLSDEEDAQDKPSISSKPSGFRESIQASEPTSLVSAGPKASDEHEPPTEAAPPHSEPSLVERAPSPPPSPPATVTVPSSEAETPAEPAAPSPPASTSRFPQTHASPASSSSFASPRSIPATESQRSIISPLEQPHAPASPFASLALGGESFGGWDGAQSTFVNDRSPPSIAPSKPSQEDEDDDDDKPLRPRPIDSTPSKDATPSKKDAAPAFFITVDDPQKVGDPIRGYTMYTVHTRTTSALYAKPTFSVLRRYSDFLWLYETLSANNPGVVVPPVPEKNPFGRFDDQFVAQRRLALQNCITKIANHPVLMKDQDLKLFLESDSFSLDIKHRKAEIAQERGGLIASIGQTIAGPRYIENDEWFDRQKSYLDIMESQLRGLVKAIEIVSKHRTELAASVGEFAQMVADLASSEIGAPLQRSLSGLADVERTAQELESEQAQQDLITLMSTADEYARLIHSVRLAFRSRIRMYHLWQQADTDVQAVRANHEKARHQGRIQADRLPHALHQVADAERRALDAKQAFDQTSRLVKTEVARFEQERVEDFKKSLERFLDGMISRQKALIAAREQFQQDLLKRVPSVGQQSSNETTSLTSVA